MPFLRRDIVRRILPIAVPVVISHMSQTLVGLVDTFMVGRISVEALAATGLAGVAIWMVLGAAGELATGTQVITSRRFGEKRFGEAVLTLRESLLLALALGGVLTLLCLWLVEPYFRIVLTDPADPLMPLCSEYTRLRLLALAPFLVISALKGYFNGIGDTKEHMRISLVVNLSNIFLNWVFIYGHLGSPAMGVAGAGLASTVATALGALLFLDRLRIRRVFREHAMRVLGAVRPADLRQLVALSSPAAVQTFLTMAGFTFFTSFMHRVGLVEVAATNLIINVMSVSFMPGFAIGIAASTMIGQDLGAGRLQQAREDGDTAQQLAMLMMSALGLLFLLIPETLLGVFTEDAGVIQAGKPALQLMGLVQAIDAMAMTTAGCLRGSGMTLFVMWAEIGINWLFFIPFTAVAVILFEAGIVTAFAGLALYLLFLAILLQWQWRGNRWQEVKV